MKRIAILAALGIFLPGLVFAQQCHWVCGSGSTVTDYSNQLQLSELLPNPVGDDTEGEFIEIQNRTTFSVDLSGWSVADASGRTYRFTEGALRAQGYLSIPRTDSKISLNNSGGETVTLLSPDDVVQDEVEFEGTAPEGDSYALSANGWSWTTDSTPGKPNVIKVPNDPPTLKVDIPDGIFANQEAEFSATASTDPDGDELQATWKFSDGHTEKGLTVTRTFTASGDYTVHVELSDGNGGLDADEYDFTVNPFDLSQNVIINELYPKPAEGEDEFIELKNTGEAIVELGGWQLTDGVRTYTFSSDAVLEPEEFIVVYKAESSIAQNDTGDSIQLSRPDTSVADSITYTSAQKGKSYSRYDSDWQWASPTPGAENQVQDTGVVLGASVAHAAEGPISKQIVAKQNFFDKYGAYLGALLLGIAVGFGLYKKWRKDTAENDEYTLE